MATTSPPTSLSLSLDSIFSSHRPSPSSLSFPSSHPFLSLHKLPSFSSKSLQNPPKTSSFLDQTSVHRLQTLQDFRFTREFHHGSLEIRPMEPQELEPTVNLLAESFAESMWMPATYVKLLAFLVRIYVEERKNLVPHAVILVGIYKEKDGELGGEAQLACTADVSFDARGTNAAPPTPEAPKNCPYICNMTVKETLRRRGIGRHLLMACEELIYQMKTIRKVYLHCRMIDKVPFQMYKKDGYKIVKTDSILVWLTLQRRKYLMCKELRPSDDSLDNHPIC